MFDWLVMEPWRVRATAGEPTAMLASREAGIIRPSLKYGAASTITAIEKQLSQIGDHGVTIIIWVLLEHVLERLREADRPAAIESVEVAEQLLGRLQGIGPERTLLRAHCQFIRGCIHQAAKDRTEAQRALYEAFSGYQGLGGQRLFEGICYAALAVLALEAGDLVGERPGWPGAREQMEWAIVSLREGGDSALADYYRQVLYRIEAQWAFLDRVLEGGNPDQHLDREAGLVDTVLFSLFHYRCRHMAVHDAPLDKVFAAAIAHERLAQRLGTQSDFLEEAIGWYGHRQMHAHVEWLLRRLLEGVPHDLSARRLLSVTLFQQARWPELVELLQGLLQEAPDDAESHMSMAIALRELGQIRPAYYHLTRVMELDPEQDLAAAVAREILPAIAFNLVDGELQVMPGAETLSEQEMQAGVFAAMLASDPSQIQARADQLMESDPETGYLALQYLEMRGLIKLPEASPALEHLERAEEHFAAARMPQAAQEYSAALALDPDLSQAYMGLGDVFYREGNYFAARAFFEESIAVKPNPLAYRFLGDSLRRIGKPAESIPCYRSALELNPDYQGARLSLEEVLASGVQPPPETDPEPDADSEAASGPAELVGLAEAANAGTGESARPRGTEALIAGMTEHMPFLPDVMAARTTEERMRIIRVALEPDRFASLAVALIAVEFHLGSKEQRPAEALSVAELRLALARDIPAGWVPGEKQVGRWRLESDALIALAQHALRQNEPAQAMALYQQAESCLDRDQHEREQQGLPAFSMYDRLFIRRHPRAILCECMARLYHRLGNDARCKDYADRAQEIDRQNPTTEVQLESYFGTAEAMMAEDDFDSALHFYYQALDLAEADPVRRISNHHVAQAYQRLAEAYAELKLHRRALELVTEAIALNRKQGHQGRLRQNYDLVGALQAARPDLFQTGGAGGAGGDEEEDPE